MSLIYAKKSDEIRCVLRVFIRATVVCGTKILMWRNIKNRVATLVRESTYIRSFKLPAGHAHPRYSLPKCVRYST
jgi:hypothetical protein